MNRAAVIALIARIHHRIELRRHRAHPQLGVAVFVGVTFGTLFVVGSLPYTDVIWSEPGAYYYGTLVSDDPATVLELTRAVASIALVVFAALAALRSTNRDVWESPPVELVTAVSLPTAILGLFGDELAESAWFVAPIGLAGSLAFAAGTGQPVAVVGTVVGVITILATGLTFGAATGLGFRGAIRHIPGLYRIRFAIGFVGLFVLFFVLTASRGAGDALARTPMGWFGDLLLLTTPGVGASPVAAGGAIAISVTTIACSFAVVFPAARTLWFAEPDFDHESSLETETGRNSEHSSEAPRSASNRFTPPALVVTACHRWLSRPTAAVTVSTWRRVRRSPRVLIFAILPFAIAGPVTADTATRWPDLVPVLVILYAAVAVGMGTTLNLLGNERVALPTILTTPGGRQSVLRGHTVAALVPGVPLAVVAGLVAAAFFAPSPAALVVLLTFAAALTAGGIGVSLGIGTVLPNLEGPTDATLTPPELYATITFFLAMALLASPAFVGVIQPEISVGVGVGLTIASTTIAGVIGYRSAARTLESYEGSGS